MPGVTHLDKREEIIAKLEATIQRMRDGETVGVAWVERTARGTHLTHYWSASEFAPANRDACGNYIGVELLRNGVTYLAACMDHDALKLSGEACGG